MQLPEGDPLKLQDHWWSSMTTYFKAKASKASLAMSKIKSSFQIWVGDVFFIMRFIIPNNLWKRYSKCSLSSNFT